MHEFHLDTIGTHLRILIDTSSPIGEDFSHIEARLSDFEKKFSRFIEGNWLANLNISRTGTLDDDTQVMLGMMLDLSEKSGGYFDPTVWKRLTELGYGKVTHTVSELVESGFWDYRDIVIEGDTVRLQGSVQLEFGWIGKWYMLSWIARFLAKHEKCLIDFGGDLYGHGAWKVWLENPFALDEVIGTIILSNQFFACSSGVKRQWGKYHHLINPHTGESSVEVIASYIEADDGMIADGYATTLCVMPWTLACETLENTPEIEGVLVSKDGDIYKTKGSMAELFH